MRGPETKKEMDRGQQNVVDGQRERERELCSKEHYFRIVAHNASINNKCAQW